MASMVKSFAVLLLIFLFMDMSSGRPIGIWDAVDQPAYQTNEVPIETRMGRKLITLDALLFDYEKPGPNPKHEKKPGGG